MKNHKPYFLLAVPLMLGLVSFCQEVKTVALTKYTVNDGLSGSYVTKIIKDSYGFMWIATQEGLNLFNGSNFQVFSKYSEPGTQLGASFVMDVTEDRKRNLLWVLTTYGDICGIDLKTHIIKKRITVDKDNEPLTGKWVRSIAIQGNILWLAGTGTISGFNLQENRFINADLIKKAGLTVAECDVAKLLVDSTNRLWIFNDGTGISVLNKNLEPAGLFRHELAYKANENSKLRFWDVAIHNRRLYAGTNWGLRIFEAGEANASLVKNSRQSLLDTTEVLGITFTSQQQAFFSVPGNCYSHDFLTGRTVLYSDNNVDDNWLTLTYPVYFDSAAQRLWIGTTSGLGSFASGATPFAYFSRSYNPPAWIKHAYSLLPYSNSEIYCGDENGIYNVNTEKNEIEKIDAGSMNLLLFKDNKNNIFVSNKSGFFILKDKKTIPARIKFPELAKLDNDHISSAIQYNDSLILFGSVILKGVSVWNTRARTLNTFHKNSPGYRINGLTIINNLYKNSKGEAFILTENSIIKFNPVTGEARTMPIKHAATGKHLSNFMDMCEAGDNYWIATYGDGITVTDKNFISKRIILTSGGLSNNCVYKVMPYKNLSVIATTNYGLNVIDLKTFSIDRYYESDGLHSSLFEQVCGFQDNEKIYAGGVNGFTVIRPGLFATNTVPPVVFLHKLTMLTRDGKKDTTNIFLDNITIPNNIRQVTISFSGLSYKNPTRTTFAYKIMENKGDWIDLGTQNFLTLQVLKTGWQTVLLRATNESGVPNPNPVKLALYYSPQWYQTDWFKLSVIALIAGIFYGIYKYRLLQLKKQQQIRKSIASDLHDDIGSTLNAIRMFLGLAKKEPGKPNHLNLAEESLDQVTIGLRDIIWVLDDSHDTLFDLMRRIKKLATPVANARGIQLEGIVTGEDDGKIISKPEKRNLLLIAKEAINNCIKYSNCKNIEVTLQRNKRQVSLSIKDDGQGFDTSVERDGNGLKNMQHRAMQIRYTFSIVSTPGQGTTINVTRKA